MYIYMYIYRERERENNTIHIDTYKLTCILPQVPTQFQIHTQNIKRHVQHVPKQLNMYTPIKVIHPLPQLLKPILGIPRSLLPPL